MYGPWHRLVKWRILAKIPIKHPNQCENKFCRHLIKDTGWIRAGGVLVRSVCGRDQEAKSHFPNSSIIRPSIVCPAIFRRPVLDDISKTYLGKWEMDVKWRFWGQNWLLAPHPTNPLPQLSTIQYIEENWDNLIFTGLKLICEFPSNIALQ